MKFDAARTMVWVQTFDFPRPANGEGVRRACKLLADCFEGCGWGVERCEVRDRRRSSLVFATLLVLTLIFSLWGAVRATLPHVSVVGRIGASLTTLAVMAVIVRLAIGRRLPPLREPQSPDDKRKMAYLVSSWPNAVERPARVVFLTYLDTPTRRWEWEDGFWAVLVVALVAFPHSAVPIVWGLWLWVALELVVIVWFARVSLQPGGTSPGINGSGLALLTELAQTLPPRIHERLDVRLVAVDGHFMGQSGATTLALRARRHWPAKPTLFINVDAPGRGADLIVTGRGPALEIARSAAQDLWLPHRVARWVFRPLDHRPFGSCGFAALSLAGGSKAARVDPSALAASAQLATEIAMRWARRHEGTDQGASLARSSQKPG